MEASRQNMNSLFASKNLVNDSFYITYAFFIKLNVSHLAKDLYP